MAFGVRGIVKTENSNRVKILPIVTVAPLTSNLDPALFS